MQAWIDLFLKEKSLEENSMRSYQYDLRQFEDWVEGQLNETKMRLYEQKLKTFKPSVAKRKASCINQFLLFIYERGLVPQYFRIKPLARVEASPQVRSELLDLDFLLNPAQALQGQCIALLAAFVGLVPNEMMGLKMADFNFDFEVIRVQTGNEKRIVNLPKVIAPFFQATDTEWLFDHQGEPYSRQWLYNQLKAYLKEIGHPDLTAKSLREQFILHEVEAGTDIMGLSKKLGLKSQVTLLKYYN